MTTRATIVIVDPSIAVTGALRCAAATARLLAPEVSTVLVLGDDAAIPATELTAFSEVKRIRLARPRRTAAALLAYLPDLFRGSTALKEIVGRTGARAVIANDFYLPTVALAKLLGCRARVVTWVRFDLRRLPRPVRTAFIAINHLCSTHVLAVSDKVRRTLPSGAKYHRLYDPVGLHQDAPCKPPAGGRDFVCVANYIEGKGQDHAISAFLALGEPPDDVRLQFYGGDMGLERNRLYRRRLEEQVAAAGATDRILFHAFESDLEKAYGGAIAALNLSESEALGMTSIEAGFHCLPLIAFRSGGPEEIVDDGRTGVLCDLMDVPAATAAMRRILDQPELAVEMGRAARAHVLAKFNDRDYAMHMRHHLGLDQVAPR